MASRHTIAIREAKLEDCDRIFQMKMALAEYHQMEHMVIVTAADIKRDAFGDNQTIRMIVAEQTDGNGSEGSSSSRRMVGYCLYYFIHDFFTGPAIHMSDLFVESTVRNDGVGTALMKYLAQVALSGNYGSIQLFWLAGNFVAETFYKGHGAVDLTENSKYHLLNMSTDDMKAMLAKDSDNGTQIHACQPVAL